MFKKKKQKFFEQRAGFTLSNCPSIHPDQIRIGMFGVGNNQGIQMSELIILCQHQRWDNAIAAPLSLNYKF